MKNWRLYYDQDIKLIDQLSVIKKEFNDEYMRMIDIDKAYKDSTKIKNIEYSYNEWYQIFKTRDLLKNHQYQFESKMDEDSAFNLLYGIFQYDSAKRVHNMDDKLVEEICSGGIDSLQENITKVDMRYLPYPSFYINVKINDYIDGFFCVRTRYKANDDSRSLLFIYRDNKSKTVECIAYSLRHPDRVVTEINDSESKEFINFSMKYKKNLSIDYQDAMIKMMNIFVYFIRAYEYDSTVHVECKFSNDDTRREKRKNKNSKSKPKEEDSENEKKNITIDELDINGDEDDISFRITGDVYDKEVPAPILEFGKELKKQKNVDISYHTGSSSSDEYSKDSTRKKKKKPHKRRGHYHRYYRTDPKTKLKYPVVLWVEACSVNGYDRMTGTTTAVVAEENIFSEDTPEESA